MLIELSVDMECVTWTFSMLPLVNLLSGFWVVPLVCCMLERGFSLKAIMQSWREVRCPMVRCWACVINMSPSKYEVLRGHWVWLFDWPHSIGHSWVIGWLSSISSSLGGWSMVGVPADFPLGVGEDSTVMDLLKSRDDAWSGDVIVEEVMMVLAGYSGLEGVG